MALALDDTNVFWTQIGLLQTVPKAGGQTTTVTTVPLSPGLAVDAEAIYWTERDTPLVRKRVKATGAQSTLWTGSAGEWAMDLVIDDCCVYWRSLRAVYRVSKQGGDATLLFTSGTDDPVQIQALAVDSQYLYWVGWPIFTGPDRLMRTLKANTSSTGPFDTSSLPKGALALALSDADVFFTTGQSPGAVQSIPKAGGTVSMLVAHQDYAFSIAHDGGQVFWSSDTSIRRAAQDGTQLSTLAVDQEQANRVVVDDSCVYWITSTGVMRVAR